MVILTDGTVFKTHNPDEHTREYRLPPDWRFPMNQPLIAVRDVKTQLFDPPFVARHTHEAIREFNLVKKATETKFGKNPEDFELYHIGDYDYSQGTVTMLPNRIQLA